MGKNSNYRGSNKDKRPVSRSTSKGRQSNSKTKSSPNEEESKSSSFVCSAGRPTNDPRWYLNNPVLSRDVGSIWFSKPIGTLLPYTSFTASLPSTERVDQLDPGIMAIPSIITWGGTRYMTGDSKANSAINLTAQKLYQFVVHANSRNISYDKKDLMMTIMAIDAIYATITEAIRAYRMIANYDPENQYTTHLLTAMKWDASNLRSNVAEFRYQINWAISRVNKFFVPGIFDMIKAHMSAYEHVYVDRPSNKAQLIVKYSPGIWLYDDVSGSLEYKRAITVGDTTVDWSSNHTVEDFRVVIQTMLAAVENAQYLGVMQGDLLKAFGMSLLMQYTYVGIDVPISPVYDEEFLLKLHNADISSTRFDSASNFWITNSAGMIYRDANSVDGNIVCYHGNFAPYPRFRNYRENFGTMIDLPTHIPPSPDNILLMTLYKLFPETGVNVKWKLQDAEGVECYEGDLNPEILGAVEIWVKPDPNASRYSISTWEITATVPNVNKIAAISRFRSHFLITNANGVTADGVTMPIWETDNVSPISLELQRRCNDVILWSLWAASSISNDNKSTGNVE